MKTLCIAHLYISEQEGMQVSTGAHRSALFHMNNFALDDAALMEHLRQSDAQKSFDWIVLHADRMDTVSFAYEFPAIKDVMAFAEERKIPVVWQEQEMTPISTAVLLQHLDLQQQLNKTEKQLERCRAELRTTATALKDYRHHFEKLTKEHNKIIHGLYWRLSVPFRFVGRRIRKVLARIPGCKAIYHGLAVLFRHGPRAFLSVIARGMLEPSAKKVQKAKEQGQPTPATWLRRYLNRHPQLARRVKRWLRSDKTTEKTIPVVPVLSEQELQMQRNAIFENPVCISVVVPLYNTSQPLLCQMIESVLQQTYPHWELCLADASDAEHRNVHDIVARYAAQDARVKYHRLEENKGIAENTNACMQLATGAYIALLDHDDMLTADALFEVAKRINDQQADFIYSDEATFEGKPDHIVHHNFKPDFSPDTLRGTNYICHLCVFKRALLDQVGMFRSGFDGSQDHDLFLRLTEVAQHVVHVPRVLYLWRSHPASTASDIRAKPYCITSGIKAVQSQLERLRLPGTVCEAQEGYPYYKVQYEIQGQPLISIVIPNKDHIDDLHTCLSSVLERSTYANYEILVVENNSVEQATFDYYQSIVENRRVKVLRWEGEFNYAAINNFAAKQAAGEYVLLLNNDIEVLTPDWMEQLLMYAQREDVGAVGAKLYYPDGSVQHHGVIVGLGGIAGHAFTDLPHDAPGYMARMWYAYNVSAVTAACMMVPRSVYEQVGGLDERYKVAFNDVDFCMKIRQAGYLIVCTPFAELTHYESKSRGMEDTEEKRRRFQGEVDTFKAKWPTILQQGDPYYNPNLTLRYSDYSLKRLSEIE